MPSCNLKTCKNRGTENSKSKVQKKYEKVHGKISFHKFPKDAERRKVWLERLGINESEIPQHAYLCSVHFADADLDRSSLISNVRLRENALPKQVNDYSMEMDDTVEEPCSERIDDFHDENNNLFLKDSEYNFEHSLYQPGPSSNTLQMELEECVAESEQLKYSPLHQPSNELSDEINDKLECSSVSTPKTCRLKPRTCTTPLLEDTPRKVFLKKVLRNSSLLYKQKIKNLQQQLQRKDTRIAQMKTVLKALKQKNILGTEQLDVLKDLSKFNVHLLKRQISKVKNVPKERQYSPELRSFALTLHYYSPRAYRYVRSKFDTCLPHTKTISKWYTSVNVQPGFHSESLKSIKERAKVVEYPLFGALIFDEMAIRQHEEYDGHIFTGYCEMGPNIECSEGLIAKEALVFIVNCINGCWKIPIGYFLVHGTNAEQKSNLVLQALTLLHEHGMTIVSVTFDGAPSNISMCSILNCNFDVLRCFQTAFKHPNTGEQVVVFFYPCHGLKLIRNCLGEQSTIIDPNGESINWQYLVKLNNVQEKERLHLANKLRKRHILFYKQKMKVKIAAQTLSTSVADALEICRSDLHLTEFEGCAPTIKFIRIINDLFDILNSKSIKQFGFKRALCESNKESMFEHLNKSFQYICQLRDKEGHLLIESRKKTGFLGFLICINSLKLLFKDLVECKDILKYIPCYKLSQDHIELFFGCIRAQGGCNNNPTSRQFKSAYKKMLVHSEIKAIDTGNCIPLECINILHISSNPVAAINATSLEARLSEIDDENDTFSECYMPAAAYLSEFSTRVIAYVAGFIVKYLLRKIKCEECMQALVGDNNDPEYNLINVKNRGKLIYPSRDVLIVCKKAETTIKSILNENDGKLLKIHSRLFLSTRVLKSLIGEPTLFFDLKKHCANQTLVEAHDAHLTKAIIYKYLDIRLYSLGNALTKDNVLGERHAATKLILFKGL